MSKSTRREVALEKELAAVEKKELRLRRAAEAKQEPSRFEELSGKIPPKVAEGLEAAFAKALEMLLKKGSSLIEKTYNKEELQQDQAVRDYAVHLKGSRKELKKVRKAAKSSNLQNMAVTTLEGVGLGALGIGMPDIVLFTGFLLRGAYEAALNYGFDYGSAGEKLWILKAVQTALLNDEEWLESDAMLDRMGETALTNVTEEMLAVQIKETAQTLALGMLMLKFVQGLPIVGIVGGLGNPVYYKKVMDYVQLKYHKRYLLGLYGKSKKTEKADGVSNSA